MRITLKREDRKLLNQYQRIKQDPFSGMVWIEDGTIGGSHSAHPNVEANKITRRLHPDYTECNGFLYSREIFTSTDLDRLAAKYCQCASCIDSRRAK